MGNYSSQEAINEVALYNQVINQAFQNIKVNNTAVCGASNTISFVTGFNQLNQPCSFSCDGCTFNLNQKAFSSCTMNSTVTASLTSQDVTSITNQLEAFIKSQASQTATWLQTAANIASQEDINLDSFASMISNATVANIVTSCGNSSVASNTASTYLCGSFTNSDVAITQDAGAYAVSNCSTNSVVSAFTNNTVLNNIALKTEQQLTQTAFGILEILLIIGLAFLVIVLIYGIYKLVKGREEDKQAATDSEAASTTVSSETTGTLGSLKE